MLVRHRALESCSHLFLALGMEVSMVRMDVEENTRSQSQQDNNNCRPSQNDTTHTRHIFPGRSSQSRWATYTKEASSRPFHAPAWLGLR